MSADVDQARRLIEAADNIAVVAHLRPDGDAVGSLLGLTLSLQSLGKTVRPVLVDGVPGRYRFLPGSDLVQTGFAGTEDLLICVDCSDQERLGFTADEMPRAPDISFDHHPTNSRFARLNIIHPEAAATAEVLCDLAPALGLPIESDVATNYLTGLVNDTIGFRTSSATPKVLRMAADLVELGAPLAELYERTLLRQSFLAARYWSYGLKRLQREDGLYWTSLRLEDRKEVGYPGPDDADLINHLGALEGAKVIIVFVEQQDGKVKVSWRAKPGLDVAAVAEAYGGGGHKAAAGAMLEGNLESVQERILEKTRTILGMPQGQKA